MEFRKIKIADLIPASYNPRKKLKPGDREYQKIKNSITEFGYVEPVIVNSDMTIVAGHQRATVLTDLGYEEIDCIVIDIDKQKEKALNIALNKITGEWNKELLADLIADLQDSDFDVSFTGFEPPEIEQLFNSIHDKKVTEDDFDIDAELEKPAVAKMGDVWTLGRHRLVVGDSTLPETYDVLMEGAKANLVVTDPPYNVDYEGSAGKIRNDHMENEQFYNFLFAAFVNMEQNMESDASIYVFHADTEGLNFRSAFKAAGFYLSGCCIWKKQSLVLGRSPYQWQHEPCLFGWKKGGKHNWYSDRKQTTIWEFDRPKKSDSHPTQKPVGLIAYPIKNSSMSNCIVLDPFGGSGSTLMACEQTGRICYTIELWSKFGLTMAQFRKDIKAAMEGSTTEDSLTAIMGKAAATAEQMKAYLKKKNPAVPQSVLDMIPLYISEGEAEGVRGDIAFAQSCLETGNFTFSGSAVNLKQNNFCGLGVTQRGKTGLSFESAQLGIRAQIQHLKAYASTDKLRNALADPRFRYVKRGCAPYVEWLGQKENPQGKGWAAGEKYGEKILSILKAIAGEGKVQFMESFTLSAPYMVRVSIPDLNIRRGPGKSYPKTGKFTGVGVFSIVEEKDGWGLLKAYAEGRDGWISLAFTTRI